MRRTIGARTARLSREQRIELAVSLYQGGASLTTVVGKVGVCSNLIRRELVVRAIPIRSAKEEAQKRARNRAKVNRTRNNVLLPYVRAPQHVRAWGNVTESDPLTAAQLRTRRRGR